MKQTSKNVVETNFKHFFFFLTMKALLSGIGYTHVSENISWQLRIKI